MKILVIDDDLVQNKSLCRCLEIMGHTFCNALDGYAGIRLAISEHPDLIILDHGLPGLPGIDTFRRLRSSPPTDSIPIIMVTSDLLMPDEREVKTTGGLYIKKMLKPELLHFYIKKVFEAHAY